MAINNNNNNDFDQYMTAKVLTLDHFRRYSDPLRRYPHSAPVLNGLTHCHPRKIAAEKQNGGGWESGHGEEMHYVHSLHVAEQVCVYTSCRVGKSLRLNGSILWTVSSSCWTWKSLMLPSTSMPWPDFDWDLPSTDLNRPV